MWYDITSCPPKSYITLCTALVPQCSHPTSPTRYQPLSGNSNPHTSILCFYLEILVQKHYQEGTAIPLEPIEKLLKLPITELCAVSLTQDTETETVNQSNSSQQSSSTLHKEAIRWTWSQHSNIILQKIILWGCSGRMTQHSNNSRHSKHTSFLY